MLIQSLGGAPNGYGYGYGFGATEPLIKGKNFNCNASICYAIGAENDKLFKQLQMAINTLAKVGGYLPLTVDGFIGDRTVHALQALVKVGLQSPPTTKEQVAAQAPALVVALNGIASAQASQGKSLAPPGTAVTYQPSSSTSTLPTPTVISTQIPDASAAAALPKPKSKTLWWILGGLAVVATVGGVGYVVYRRKA